MKEQPMILETILSKLFDRKLIDVGNNLEKQ